MEKDQPDSLATVAVGSEKIPQPHSHYAPSEVYSSTEPPPAYMRPLMKSTAIQIARIAAMTMITMSVILGSFILAASWVQARASCTPESIAAMQAELKFQQQQREARFYQQQGEFLKHLQPEPLIGDPIESKDSLQRLAESNVAKKEVEAESTKDMKMQKEEEDSKVDSESGDHDEDDEDYDDDGFPPVHIKLPLQLDLDDSLGTLMQQARNRISCVVERRRADEVTDGINDNTLDSNNTDAGRFQRLSGERVAILCESGNPNQQETQEQEMLTLVPLGTVQIPLQPQEPSAGYHQYQINTQYQVPDMQQLPLSNPRGLNHIPQDILSAEFRNAPGLNMDMRPPRMGPQVPSMGPQVEMRHVEVHHLPIDILRGMRPPMIQEQQQPQARQEPQQAIPVIYQHNEQNPGMYGQEQGAAMMPPPPPQSASTVLEQRIIPQMMIATEQKPPAPPQQSAERQRALFQDPQSEIEKIIQEIPSEIKNFIQHLTGSEVRFPVPEGARREMVEGLVFPVPRFPLPLRSVDSLEVPVEARAEVTAEQSAEPQHQQQQQQQQQQHPQQLSEERQREQPLTHLIIQQEQEQQEQQNPQELENRPHYVQPRSVRSVPDALNPAAHRREKRMRRCACDCAC